MIFELDKETTDDIVKGLGKEAKKNRPRTLLTAATRWSSDNEEFSSFKQKVAPTAPGTNQGSATMSQQVGNTAEGSLLTGTS